MVLMLIGVALTGTILYNAIGLWVSIFSAKAVDFDSMWNNRLSLGANAVILIGVLLPFLLGSALLDRYGWTVLIQLWWAPWITAFVAIGFYLLSFHNVDPAMRLKAEAVIRRIAGAS
jgi:hypothetical protein